jgi:hypothetical protein
LFNDTVNMTGKDVHGAGRGPPRSTIPAMNKTT